MTNLAFADVDVALRLTASVLGLDRRAISAVLQRHIANRLQVTQVPLIGDAEFNVQFVPVSSNSGYNVRRAVRVGKFVRPAMGTAGRVARVYGGLPERYLPILTDQFFDKILFSRGPELSAYSAELAPICAPDPPPIA